MLDLRKSSNGGKRAAEDEEEDRVEGGNEVDGSEVLRRSGDLASDADQQESSELNDINTSSCGAEKTKRGTAATTAAKSKGLIVGGSKLAAAVGRTDGKAIVAPPRVTAAKKDQLPMSVAAAAAEAATGAADRGQQGLVALKRSVSPSTHSQLVGSREEHLQSIGGGGGIGSVDAVDAAIPHSPQARSAAAQSDLNVRGSLTLLKTRAAGSRRRRSVADIEGTQQQPPQDEEAPNAANATSMSANVPFAATAAVCSDRDAGGNKYRDGALPPGAATTRVSLDLTSYAPQKGQEVDEAAEAPDASTQMLQCPDCARRFNPEPFAKHVKICAQVFLRKRKAFDSAQMRVEGNPDLKSYLEGEGLRPGGKVKGSKQQRGAIANNTKGKANISASAAAGGGGDGVTAKWREDSNAFRKAMQSARQVTTAIATGAPLPPPVPSAPDKSLVQCPHCERRFNANAADRHIPQCQNIRAKPSVLKRGGGGNASKGGGGGSSGIGGGNSAGGAGGSGKFGSGRSWQ